LIARSTAETAILERLTMRIGRARHRLAVSSPLENDRPTSQSHERAVARLVIDGGEGEAGSGLPDEATATPSGVVLTSFAAEAAAETDRLSFARRLEAVRGGRTGDVPHAGGPWLVRARLRATRIRLDGRAIAIVRIGYEDGQGRVFDWRLVPIAFPLARDRGWTPKDVETLLRSDGERVRTLAHDAAAGSFAGVERHARGLADTRKAREQAIIEALCGTPSPALQRGLFDRRAESAWLSERTSIDEAREASLARLAWCDRIAVISERPAELLLLMVP
jgi:hypothetical protein